MSIKPIIHFIFAVALCLTAKAQNTIPTLTQTQCTEDFEYLYNALKASYPYFGINKRVYNTDWLSKKDEYINAIKKAESNKAFFKIIIEALNDLNNGHTDAYPTIIYSYFYNGFKQAVAQYPKYKPYVDELEKTDSIRSSYWKRINRELYFPELLNNNDNNTTVEETITETPENIEVNFIDSISTAMVHVKSFSYDLVEQDAGKLKQFFDKAHKYNNLIIDIQGNDGGSTEYWLDNMIPHIINDTINYPLVYGFKNSERLKKFKPSYFKNTIAYEDIALPNMPSELRDGSYLFRKEYVSIAPTPTSKEYSGNIYLLVDNEVFSSSEALAYFCKATNFARVVGEKTNGDGVGTDPLLVTLPNSGIVIRFTGEMGLNPDGSANDETKTVPDIIIKANSKEERRHKLLNYINTKK